MESFLGRNWATKNPHALATSDSKTHQNCGHATEFQISAINPANIHNFTTETILGAPSPLIERRDRYVVGRLYPLF